MNADEVDKLIDKYGTDIYQFCVKLCGNKPDTEDLYQQTFLRAMEIDISIKWDENPKSFLFSITNGIWKNNISKQSRRDRIAPSIAIDECSENLLADAEDIEKGVITKIQNKELRDVIQLLPEKFRVPIILYYSFETPLDEIAKITSVPKGTIKSRLHKGRNLIKKGLEERGYEYA